MYVICSQCDDVYNIFKCKKIWENSEEKYPKYYCDGCRNILKKDIQNDEVRAMNLSLR